ncbi:MAG TPA: alpha/beta hydrolase, partial [Usitatibacter sp.]|nr:alpha/beta hydrolase [Usitatibacter sp.]
MAKRIIERFDHQFDLRHFDYQHPERLQKCSPRFRRAYAVKVAYTEWGERDNPTVVCCGGVANTAMRFNYLAADLQSHFHVACMDWVGRGRSGWMADQGDYSLATYVEQLRQMIEHLDCGPVILLGSSMGGSAAIELAARHPRMVRTLILNDIGPFIPKARRKRRSETLARHYVFRDPADLLRKIGASQKNDGPISDDIRFNVTFHQTRWSDEEGGRVYRHDVRALQAFRNDAQESLDQWHLWKRVRCPILLVHGMLSDALLPATLRRMREGHRISVMHVPDTGHTPVLSDRNQNWFIHEWLMGRMDATEWTVLHASLREEPAKAPRKEREGPRLVVASNA